MADKPDKQNKGSTNKAIESETIGNSNESASNKGDAIGFSAFIKKNYSIGILFAIIMIFILLQLNMFAQLKQLPSPLYGGDFNYHHGFIEHLASGGSAYENSQIKDAYPWTPASYHLAVLYFSKLTGFSLLKAQIYINIIFTIVIGFLSWLLAKAFLEDELLSLCFPAYVLALYTPYFHYHALRTITMLFFVHMLFKLFGKMASIKYSVLAGLSYGLVLISHASAGVAASFLLMLYFGYLFLMRYIKALKPFRFDFAGFKKGLKANLPYAAVVFFTGFIIGLIYWFKPIFIYHLHTPNNMQDFTYVRKDTLFFQLKIILTGIKAVFFNFNLKSPLMFFFSLLFIPSVFVIGFLKKKPAQAKFLLFLLASCFIALAHPIITQNLLGFSLTPKTLAFYTLIVFKAMFVLYAIKLFVSSKLRQKRKLVYAMLLVFVVFLGNSAYTETMKSNPYWSMAEQPLPGYLLEFQSWVKQNTGVNDVFISDNEDSFMLNALTGRKLVSSRRGHVGMFVDIEQRFIDAALILYGNNDSLRRKLIKKYNVSYLFWHYRWLDNDFRIDNKGNIVAMFDPFLLKYSKETEKKLKDANISYQRLNTWLDPALKSADYKKYDCILVYPSSFNSTHPWSEQLDSYLVEAKAFYSNGRPMAKIYRVRLD